MCQEMKVAKTVTVVTVTYGQREQLLRQVLDSVRCMDVSKVIVVDNGAQWPVRSELTAAYGDLVDVVEMGANTGSAKGFATGIQRAVDLGADYIWLLDDDNCPRSDTLQELRDAYANALTDTACDRLAVQAFRPDTQADVALGVAAYHINPRTNSFYGFHVLDIPYKIWRRTPWGRPVLRGLLPSVVAFDIAPYGGLLFHREVIQFIGLPNVHFVLYADDGEFTYRITKSGGKILLVTSARIDEIELSWNDSSRFANSFIANLNGVSDFRAYYYMRNHVYLGAIMKENKFAFWLNRSVYMFLLFIYSVALGKGERYRLLQEAVADGLAGRLGMNERFPL